MEKYQPKASVEVNTLLIQLQLSHSEGTLAEGLNFFRLVSELEETCKNFADFALTARKLLETGATEFMSHMISQSIPLFSTPAEVFYSLDSIDMLESYAGSWYDYLCLGYRKEILRNAIPIMSRNPEIIEQVLEKSRCL